MTYEDMAECIELRAKGVSWNNLSLIYGKDYKVILVEAINALIYGREYFTDERLKKAADKKMRYLRKLGFSLIRLYELQAMYGVLSPDELESGIRPSAISVEQPHKAQRKTRKDKGVKRVKQNHYVPPMAICADDVSKFRPRYSREIKRILNAIDRLFGVEKGKCI